MNNKKKRNSLKIITALVFLLCLVAPAYYSHFLIKHAVNAPYWDDYDSLLKFLNLYTEAKTAGDKLGLILSQHNEHRIVFLRLIAISVHRLGGRIDFKWLSYIGNGALFLIAFFLFLAFKIKSKIKLLYFSPVLFLLFQPQYYDSILWPTALLTHFYVLALALITFFLIEKKSFILFAPACFLAALAIFSQGNGLLLAPLGLAMLLVLRNYRRAGGWLLISAAALAVYFIHYGQLPGNPNPLEAIVSIKRTLLYILYFTGSAAGFSLFIPSLLFGIIIIGYFIFLTTRKYYRENPVFYFFFLFVLLTISLSALLRSEQGADFALSQPRYRIIALLSLIIIYLSFYERINRKKSLIYAAATGLLVASVFSAVSFSLYSPKVVSISESIKRGLLKWPINGQGLYYPFPAKANKILKESIEKAVYKYPDDVFKNFIRRPHAIHPNKFNQNLRYFLDTVASNEDYIYVDGWAFLSTKNAGRQKISVILNSAQKSFIAATIPIRRPDIAAKFHSRRLENSGFAVLIRKKGLPPGKYRVGIAVVSRQEKSLDFSQKYVAIPGKAKSF